MSRTTRHDSQVLPASFGAELHWDRLALELWAAESGRVLARSTIAVYWRKSSFVNIIRDAPLPLIMMVELMVIRVGLVVILGA